MNKLKRMYRGISIFMVVTLLCTALPMQGFQKIIFADTMASNIETADITVKLDPRSLSKFNNGEFQGWGTSLCWWANRIGYSDELTRQATKYFYNLKDGLGMNIGRYNIGGGDDPTHNHIKRSDSKVPGWATNWEENDGIIAADTTTHGAISMTSKVGLTTDNGIKLAIISTDSTFDVKGENFKWTMGPEADKNQIDVVKQAKQNAGEEFILEAFSNSPPYFMTNSGCSTGAHNAWEDNLREDCYEDFAEYLAQVALYFEEDLGIPFQSISPMNEPDTSYWGENSNKQEGCHFDPGTSQSNIINILRERLDGLGLNDMIIAGTDETSVDKQVNSYNQLGPTAKTNVGRIDTHTYGGSRADRIRLRTLAERDGKNLWMSEVDGGDTAGDGAGEMGAGLALGRRITTDMNGLMPTAWILWNAIDNHIEEGNEFIGSDCDHSEMINTDGGYWGIAVADHDKKEIILTKKYYAYGQYSKYIRPGYTIITSSDDTVAAYDKEGQKVVIVAMNTSDKDMIANFDLSHFSTMENKIEVIRTSGDMESGENWANIKESIIGIDTENRNFQSTLTSNSITTYIIKGVEYADEGLEEIELNKGMVTGSTPWGDNLANGVSNVVDGDILTFFDGVTKGYATIDLEKTYDIDAIAYAAREGYAYRCVNASFYGSVDGENWEKVYTIENMPSSTNYHYIYSDEMENNELAYRYIKYAVPEDDEKANCNIAEIKLFGTLSEDGYDDITNYPEYLERGSLEGLPTTLVFSHGTEELKEENITWDVVSGNLSNLIGANVTVAATLEENIPGYGKVIKKELPVISTNLQYFIDCGEETLEDATDTYKFINSKVSLKNKDSADQAYDESIGWGYVGDKGRKDKTGTGLNATGYYGKGGNPITYKVKLDTGTYEILSGHYEWWNTSKRVTAVKVAYGDNGELIEKNIGNIAFDGTYGRNGIVNGEFTVPNDETVVTITFSKGSGSIEDAVVSYFAIDKLSEVGVDTVELQGLYDSYAKVEMKDKIYTEKSWSNLKGTLEPAKEALENPTKDNVREATEKCKEAIAGLVMLPIEELEERISKHGNVLYIVNAGNELNADDLPIGIGHPGFGYYQSNIEQKEKVDQVKGTKWGYWDNDSTIQYGTAGEGKTAIDTLRYISDKVVYDQNETGIYYNFQLPKDTKYEVTVGFHLPKGWNDRTVAVSLNSMESDEFKIYSEETIEKTYKIIPDKDELNLKVYSPNRTSSYFDACISYIMIRVPIKYSESWLANAIKNYELTAGQRELYSRQSLDKYDEAYEYANRVGRGGRLDLETNTWVYDSKEADSGDRIKSYYLKLIKKYEGLQKKNNPVVYENFSGTDGDTWYDTEGVEIQAHGGQVIKFKDTWYWYGEDKTDGYRTVDGGVRVYSSTDLYNWKEEGVALRNLTDMYDFEEDYFAELYKDYDDEQKKQVLLAINDSTSVIERPKVIYNEKTDKYVMWFHADGPVDDPEVPDHENHNYYASCAGVAVSDSPTGPFKFIERSRLNYVEGMHPWRPGEGMARDMNLFVDDDGTGYIIYSSEGNATLIISKLNAEYTGLYKTNEEGAQEGIDFIRSECFVGQHREAPAIFKYNEKYYLMTSGCTGWGANQASYAVADSMLGTWENKGDPTIEDKSICKFGSDSTFGTQSTCVFAVDEEGYKGYVYMGDRWNNSDWPKDNNLYNPTYVWIPVEFGEEGEMILRPKKDWTLDELKLEEPEEPEEPQITIKGITTVQVKTKVGVSPKLPTQVEVVYSNNTTDQMPVVWDSIPENKYSAAGTFEVEGTVEGTDLKAKVVVSVEGSEEPEKPEITIKGITTVQVKTKVGVSPKLPTQVEVLYSNNTTDQMSVVWDSIPENKYSAAGTFEVEGTVEGTDLKAKAVVSVEGSKEPEKPEITIKGITAVQVKTKVGVSPKLPTQVEAIYSNNTIVKMSVVWDFIPESKYSVAGTFEVEGAVEGTDLRAKAVVSVEKEEANGGGSSSSGNKNTKPKVDNKVDIGKPIKKELEIVNISLLNGLASNEVGNLKLLVNPYIQDGRTMVGVRDIATLLKIDNKDIIWDAANKVVWIKRDNKEIKFVIGQKYVTVNGEKIVLDIAPEIKDGRVVLPIAHLAKVLEIETKFVAETKEVILVMRR